MARRRFALKPKWRKLLFGSLAVLLCAGAVFGVVSASSGRDTIELGNGIFSVGGLDDQGAYVKSEQSLVSDFFECRGLTVDPTDHATGTYRVFYYDADKKLVGSTEVIEPKAGIYRKGDSFLLATYARVMITPVLEQDEDAEEAPVIRFYQVSKYADAYVISVDRDQEATVSKLNFVYVSTLATDHYTLTVGEGVDARVSPDSEFPQLFYLTNVVNIKKFDCLVTSEFVRYVHFWDADEKLCAVSTPVFDADFRSNTVLIPENAVSVSFTLMSAEPLDVYGVCLDK